MRESHNTIHKPLRKKIEWIVYVSEKHMSQITEARKISSIHRTIVRLSKLMKKIIFRIKSWLRKPTTVEVIAPELNREERRSWNKYSLANSYRMERFVEIIFGANASQNWIKVPNKPYKKALKIFLTTHKICKTGIKEIIFLESKESEYPSPPI